MRAWIIALVFSFVSVAHADVLTLPQAGDDASAQEAPTQVPKRGQSMSSVKQNFGEPASHSGPVGEPPITRWDYGDFIVFFEYTYVINTVVPKRPSRIYQQEELRQGPRS